MLKDFLRTPIFFQPLSMFASAFLLDKTIMDTNLAIFILEFVSVSLRKDKIQPTSTMACSNVPGISARRLFSTISSSSSWFRTTISASSSRLSATVRASQQYYRPIPCSPGSVEQQAQCICVNCTGASATATVSGGHPSSIEIRRLLRSPLWISW